MSDKRNAEGLDKLETKIVKALGRHGFADDARTAQSIPRDSPEPDETGGVMSEEAVDQEQGSASLSELVREIEEEIRLQTQADHEAKDVESALRDPEKLPADNELMRMIDEELGLEDEEQTAAPAQEEISAQANNIEEDTQMQEIESAEEPEEIPAEAQKTEEEIEAEARTRESIERHERESAERRARVNAWVACEMLAVSEGRGPVDPGFLEREERAALEGQPLPADHMNSVSPDLDPAVVQREVLEKLERARERVQRQILARQAEDRLLANAEIAYDMVEALKRDLENP